MSAAGGSAERWAAQLRADARRGLWRRLMAWLDLSPTARRADAQARRSRLGGEWERYTAAMLAPLEADGWHVLHDRQLPGSKANLDHVLIPPNGAAVVVLDTKRWHAQRPTRLVRGRVCCGGEDRHEQIEKVAGYAARVARLLGLPAGAVVPLLVVHGSPITGGRLGPVVDGRVVHVLGPGWLVPTLVASSRGRDAVAAVGLAARVGKALPEYPGGA